MHQTPKPRHEPDTGALDLLRATRAAMGRDDAAAVLHRLSASRPDVHADALAALYREIPWRWRWLVVRGDTPVHKQGALDSYLKQHEPVAAAVLFDRAIDRATRRPRRSWWSCGRAA